jgi:hypothetical protein
LLSTIFKAHGFPIFCLYAYLMDGIPEIHRAHQIRFYVLYYHNAAHLFFFSEGGILLTYGTHLPGHLEIDLEP